MDRQKQSMIFNAGCPPPSQDCPDFCLLYFFFFLISIVIQLQLYAFSPYPSIPPQLNPPPSPTSTLPLDFVAVSFIIVPVIPSPHFPLAMVRLFLTSIRATSPFLCSHVNFPGSLWAFTIPDKCLISVSQVP